MPTSYKLNDSVMKHIRRDFTALPESMTVGEALESIRQAGLGEKVIYFYVLDGECRLQGVIPTRRLLTAPLSKSLPEIMISNIVSIPSEATLFDACEFFVMHRLLAFPVVDSAGRMEGVIDVELFADELFNMSERKRLDEIFDVIGFNISQLQRGGPAKSFRIRFPWLGATIISGVACAVLASLYEATLDKSLTLAFFMTLALGLGESVGVQTMTSSIHSLRHGRLSWRWFKTEFLRQSSTGLMLGAACSALVFLVVWLWRGEPDTAAAIGLSILASELFACIAGLSIPALFHWLKHDPKIASGPITLALTDIMTIFIYFEVASLALRP